MSFENLAIAAFVFAALPAILFTVNLLAYSRLSCPTAPQVTPAGGKSLACKLSVLIPARNEEKNIRATLEAVLSNRKVDFEVIVLDDHSTDSTARIVQEFASRDARLRLESAPPLPEGWCGKQHACYVLARLAQNPLLVFIDADVRLAPDALQRMAFFMQPELFPGSSAAKRQTAPALASGVPHQHLVSFSERLLLPLIHFILLGFLPMHAMRRTLWAAMSAGCGQLFIAHREAYFSCGGHGAIRSSLHDGVMLPRVFRRAGFTTDLFDATDVASCRMYQTNDEVWRGLGKNATEGLAAPGAIIPMTALLLVGQVLPFVMIACAPLAPVTSVALAAAAAILAYLPRVLAAIFFRQPWSSVLLHPIGILSLLAIQWQALLRRLLGRPAEWKGRQYPAISAGRA